MTHASRTESFIAGVIFAIAIAALFSPNSAMARGGGRGGSSHASATSGHASTSWEGGARRQNAWENWVK